MVAILTFNDLINPEYCYHKVISQLYNDFFFKISCFEDKFEYLKTVLILGFKYVSNCIICTINFNCI